MRSRVETLTKAILNGGTVSFEPHSRMETYLMRCLEGGGTEGLPKPNSRVDSQLYAIIDSGGIGTGGTYVPDEDIATDEEFNEVIDNVFGEDESGSNVVSEDTNDGE